MDQNQPKLKLDHPRSYRDTWDGSVLTARPEGEVVHVSYGNGTTDWFTLSEWEQAVNTGYFQELEEPEDLDDPESEPLQMPWLEVDGGQGILPNDPAEGTPG